MAGYGQAVATVQLRPIRAVDLAALGDRPQEDDPFGFFGHRSVNGLERRFAVDGLISDDAGQLAVQTPDGSPRACRITNWSPQFWTVSRLTCSRRSVPVWQRSQLQDTGMHANLTSFPRHVGQGRISRSRATYRRLGYWCSGRAVGAAAASSSRNQCTTTGSASRRCHLGAPASAPMRSATSAQKATCAWHHCATPAPTCLELPAYRSCCGTDHPPL